MSRSRLAAAFVSGFVSRSLAGRDYAVDVLRGLAVTGMILVNHAPPADAIYAPFVHAPWHGWTMADTIFPAFLFVVGVSIAFASRRGSNQATEPSSGRYWKMVRRSLALIAISLVLVNFPYYEWHKLKLAGVLAHIAWCYLAVSLIYLHTTWRGQLAGVGLIWLGTWVVLALLEVPGFGAGNLTPEGNASTYVDRLLLGRHASVFEDGAGVPYGFLIITSSIGTTLTGALAGQWLLSAREQSAKVGGLFAAGFALVVLSLVWDVVLPINKLLWTSSFVAFTTGVSLQVLATLYWLDNFAGFRALAKPLHIAGVNALVFYVFAQSLQRLLVYGRVTGDDGAAVRLRHLIYQQWFVPLDSGKFGALAYVLAFLLVCFAVVAVLYRKRIYIKL